MSNARSPMTRRNPVARAVLALIVSAVAAQSQSARRPGATEAQSARRTWEGSYLELVSASPDGRLVSNMDELYGNMWVRDVRSGKTRAITGNTSYATWTGVASSSVFSPDSKELAYVWSSFAAKRTEIRIGGVDSTPPRVIYQADTTVRSISVEDWTSDGAYLATVLARGDGSSQLLLISTATGAQPRVIRTFVDWLGPSGVRVSPDGRYIAYSIPASRLDGRREVHVLSLGEGRDQLVARSDADDAVLGWTADGAHLVFSSERGGSPGVWSAPMSDGRPSGEPRLVRGDIWRMIPLRLTASGNLFYLVQAGDRQLNIASFDASTGQMLSTPTA